MRVGMGFDIHRLTAGRPLILGGLELPLANGKGLQGHSDADVLLHALCDALLGAVGAGDIGSHFPDSDPQWKSASSRLFVAKAMEEVRRHGCSVANADFVVLAEAPKIEPHREAIRGSVAALLSVDRSRVNLKSKTMEGLGPIGAGEAIAAYAVVLLEEKK